MTFVVTKIDASKCVIRVTQLFKLCIHEKDKNKKMFLYACRSQGHF